MVFHSLDFLVFFAAVFPVYWALPTRAQNVLLLVVSALFYGYVHPWFLLPLAFSLGIDFFCALRIAQDPARKRRYLLLSLVSNLSLLAVFKYSGFALENLNAVRAAAGVAPLPAFFAIALPAGISFYVFHTLSYVIDVYRGEVPARQRFVDLAAFVMFFPQLVAGPIARASQLLPQFERARRFDPAVAQEAVVLLAWGFFKKMVIADTVAVTAEKIFSLERPTFPVLWAGVFAFTIQIVADFSGYTDIARGLARLFGFELAVNFNHPYLAKTPDDFWSRWHISLSTWMRDYLYVPLGGNRGSRASTARNVLLVFAISGLWHGASWNFVLWGLYWAALVIAYRALGALVPAPWKTQRGFAVVQVPVLFALTMVGWLLFRETETALLWRDLTLDPRAAPTFEWQAGAWLALHTLLFALPLALHAAGETWLARSDDTTFRRTVLLPALGAVLMCGLMILRSGHSTNFIYFQF